MACLGRGVDEIHDPLCEEILIGDAPRTLEFGIDEIFLFDESVKSVADEKRAHLIKNTLAAIQKERRVTTFFQDASEIDKTVARLRPLHGTCSR